MAIAPRKYRGGRVPRRSVDTRASAAARGYDARWAKLAKFRLALEPFCRICAASGITTPATVADHVLPIFARPDLRLVLENTQALCVACNTRKGIEDADRFGRVGTNGGLG